MYLARVLKQAGAELHAIARSDNATQRHLRDRVVAVAAITVIVDVLAGFLAYTLERNARGTDIHTIGDALFWTSTQLLTVSSQFKNPLTTGGKILDVALEAYAITVVATLAGSFGAFFHRRGNERDSQERDSRATASG